MGSVQHDYRGDIQGLRAIAVLPVVLFHAVPEAMPGGFLGVDVFFVISGYLITKILLRDLVAERMTITGFYVRRVKRLFPALYAMLLVTAGVGLVLLPDDDRVELFGTIAGTALFVSNLVFLRLTDYFGGAAELKPLLHTWSLAVEEQFYLVFPPMLAVAFKYAKRHITALLGVLAAASFAACVVLVSEQPEAAFYLPFTRAWELLTGSLLAAGIRPRRSIPLVQDGMSVAGLTLILAGMVLVKASMPFPGWLGLLPVLGTALVLYGGEGRLSWAGRVLSAPSLVWVGGLSYSLYLWHWPILVYLKWLTLSDLSLPLAAVGVSLSVLAAWVSLVLFEQPALRLKWSAAGVLMAGGTSIAVFVAAAFVTRMALPASPPAPWESREANSRRAECHGEGRSYIPYNRLCVYGSDRAPRRDLVWGDSYGAELPIVLAEQGATVVQASSSACPPSEGYEAPQRPHCKSANSRRLREIAADASVRRVYMVANYLVYPATDAPALVGGMAASARTLKAAGKEVVFLYPIPQPPMNVPDLLELAGKRGWQFASLGTPKSRFDTAAGPWVAELDRVTHSGAAAPLQLDAALCRTGRCRVYEPGVGALYFDRSHLGISGIRFALRAQEPAAK